jgi:hypothetical protein
LEFTQTIKLLKTILTAGLLQAQTSILKPAYADLGAAEAEVSSSSHDAFCAKLGNKCKVIFDKDKMRIGDSDGISRSQVLRIWQDEELRGFWDRTPGNYYYPVYYVSYKKSDGDDSTAKFIFINWPSGLAFWNSLSIFTGPERRTIGPSIQVEIKK